MTQDTLQTFASATSYVPGIGTALSAVAGFAKALNGGEPQVRNPFRGAGFAARMYDPPPAWRAGKGGGNVFAGALWGYKPHPDDVRDWKCRQARAAAQASGATGLEPVLVDGSFCPVGKSIFQKEIVDQDQAQVMVKRVLAQVAKRPKTPSFYYLKPEKWQQFLRRRYEAAKNSQTLHPFASILFAKSAALSSFPSFATWESNNGPSLWPVFKQQRAADGSRLADELADYAAFAVALQHEQEKAAFIAQAKSQAEAAAIAAYDYALSQSAGGHTPPPLPPPQLPPDQHDLEQIPNPSLLLDMSAMDPGPAIPTTTIAAGGLGILALLL